MNRSYPGFRKVERVLLLSALTLIGIGAAEILVGILTDSIAVIADGFDSVADSSVTLIVWSGLRISQRAPDHRFHYGYFRVESLASMLAAIVMVGISAVIFYNAYFRFLAPLPIVRPLLALLTLLVAGSISLGMALYKRKLALQFNLLSLKADAYNSIKDGSASFIAFLSIGAATLGFHQMDSIGAMIISGFIAVVAATILKEASLALVDAVHNPALVGEIKEIVERTNLAKFKELRLRRAGQYIVGEMVISVAGSKTVKEMSQITRQIEQEVKDEVEGMRSLLISVEPM